MNFEQRALKARQRGAYIRAAVLLIEGLKRHPDEQDALALLCEIYVEDIDSSGLEFDLTRILVAQGDPEAYFAEILERLRARRKEDMGRELIRLAADEGLHVTWPPPRANPNPTAAQQTSSSDMVSDAAGIDVSAAAAAQPQPEEAPGEKSTRIEAKDAEDIALGPARVEPELPAPAPQTRQANSPEDQPGTLLEAARNNPPDSATPQVAPPSMTPIKPRTKGRVRRTLFIALVGLAITGGGLWWWNSAAPSRSPGALDSAIETSDPALESSRIEIFGGAPTGSEATEFAERRAFIAAVYAAEWGKKSAASTTQQTAWGLASAATSRALRGEFEQALSAAARLERQYPGALASDWAQGFVAESRGQFGDATAHYLAGQARHPDFAPFLSAQLRIALRQAQSQKAAKLKGALEALSPKNPYLHLDVEVPTLEDLDPTSKEERAGATTGVLPVERPRFVRAIQHLRRAVAATQDQDWQRARTESEASLSADPQLGPALFVAGVLRAGDFEVARSDDAWMRLAQIPGLSTRYRWMIQVGAPRTLSAAGRPDLGYKYIVRVKALGKIDPRELSDLEKAFGAWRGDAKIETSDRPDTSEKGAPEGRLPPEGLPESVVPLLSVEEKLKDTPLAEQAILARAEVLNLLGLTRAADETLSLLDGVSEVGAARASLRTRIAIRRGDLRRARAAAHGLKDSSQGDGTRAEIAYYSGEYKQATKLATRALKKFESVDVLRALVLSQLALGRGRLALSSLNAARVAPLQRSAYRALKMRVERPDTTGDPDDKTTFKILLNLNPTSVARLVDLANQAFAQRDFELARALAERALTLADADPAAHWIMGLIEHISSHNSAADRHFRAAWRKDPSDPLLLVEIGRIYLSMEKPRLAQRAFYRALLRDRSSTTAIRGLGRAYQAYSPRTGMRDLSRILSGYDGASHYLAQSVETLRALAILSGARDGKEAGIEYLRRAVLLIGESADLLLEIARYHAARGDTEKARELFGRVLQKDSTRAEARIGLARMAIKTGDGASAVSQLRRYLRFVPDGEQSEWARNTLARLERAGEEPPNPE